MTIAELRKDFIALGSLGDVYEFKKDGHYVMFVNPAVVDIIALANCRHALPNVTVIPITPAPGQTIDDAIRIYQEKTK